MLAPRNRPPSSFAQQLTPQPINRYVLFYTASGRFALRPASILSSEAPTCEPSADLTISVSSRPTTTFQRAVRETYTSGYLSIISSALCCKHPFKVLSCRYLTVLSSLSEHVHVHVHSRSRCQYLNPGLEDPHRILSCRFFEIAEDTINRICSFAPLHNHLRDRAAARPNAFE